MNMCTWVHAQNTKACTSTHVICASHLLHYRLIVLDKTTCVCSYAYAHVHLRVYSVWCNHFCLCGAWCVPVRMRGVKVVCVRVWRMHADACTRVWGGLCMVGGVHFKATPVRSGLCVYALMWVSIIFRLKFLTLHCNSWGPWLHPKFLEFSGTSHSLYTARFLLTSTTNTHSSTHTHNYTHPFMLTTGGSQGPTTTKVLRHIPGPHNIEEVGKTRPNSCEIPSVSTCYNISRIGQSHWGKRLALYFSLYLGFFQYCFDFSEI